MKYAELFEPVRIGNLELKNRFVMPAMDSSTTTPEHKFSRQSIDYFAARAKGGFALVITEFMAVDPTGFATPNQVGIYAGLAEEAGADAIHLSTGTASGGNIVTPYYTDPGFNLENAARIKKCVKIPVIGVGRINDPALAWEAVASGKADLISLGRQSICDSEFPNKIREGREEEIFHCTGCMQRCYYSPGCDKLDKGISCMINPFSGKEGRWIIREAETKKKILIAGGGVAGLEAAWILARRGHEVSLYEKEDAPGGQYRLAAVPPKKQDLGKTVHTYLALGRHYGVRMHTHAEVTEELLESLDFDVCLLATGAKPLVPPIPGLAESGAKLANEVLGGRHVIAGENVLIIGGGLVGCECGEFLLQYENRVDLVDMITEFAPGLNKYPRAILLKKLADNGTEFYGGTKVLEIRKDGILGQQGEEQIALSGYSSIVLALGSRPFAPLKEKAEKLGKEVYVLGDASSVRDAKYAIFDAAKLALEL